MQQLLSTHSDDLKAAVLVGTPAAVAGVLLLRRWLRARSLPPGPASVPLLGSPRMLDQSQLHVAIQRASKQYGDIFSFRLGQLTVIAVTSYEMIKEMLAEDLFSGRIKVPVIERLVENCGIISADGASWSVHRRLSLHILRDFGFARDSSVQMVDNALDGVFEDLDSLCQSQQATETLDIFLAASNSVIAQLTFGKLFDRNDVDYVEFCEIVKCLLTGNIFPAIMLYPNLDYIARLLPADARFSQQIEKLHEFISKQIREREKVMEDEDCEPDCLCDVYIQERRKAEKKGDFETFKEMQLIRVCFELFLAGTDTTARSLEWLLLFMAFNPDVQRKVQAELDSVVGQSRRPRLSDKTNLHYVCAVIDEGYRKASLVPVGLVHRAMEDTYFRGHFIPDDALILPCVHSVHHDERLWARPNDFYPEHFLDANNKYKSSPYLIPFLVGKRACLGESLARMEVFLLFTSAMQRYWVKPDDASLRNREKILDGPMGILRMPGSHYGLSVSRR